MHVLIVEDDPALVESLQVGLDEAQYASTAVRSAEEAREKLKSTQYDLILLDIELPGEDGFVLLREIRQRKNAIPVLIMSGGRKQLRDRVEGLELGADDYLLKPFSFSELRARIRAILRRATGGESLVLRVADLEIDLTSRRVSRAGRTLEFTQREYALLEYLARRAGQTVTREMIANDVWKEPARATPLDNVIDVHISHLRQKIDEEAPTRLIHTVWGKGFVMKQE